MKKTGLWAFAFAVLAMAGCDTKEEVRVYDRSAAADVAGVYNGLWTVVDDKGNASEGQGIVVFETLEEQAYVMTMTFVSEAIGLNVATPANVTHAGDELVFYNNSAKALLPEDAGTDATIPSFQGRVKTDGTTSFSYSLKTGKGKKAKVNTYTFAGKLENK